MLTCREVTRIISSSSDRLSLGRKMGLKLHLVMCKYCADYALQLTMLADSVRKLFDRATPEDIVMIESVEDQIIKKILK